MFLCLDQTAWTAIAAIGSIFVVIVALIPVFLDKPRLKINIKSLEEIGNTGRYKYEITIVNFGRRKINIDNLVIEYVDIEPHIITIQESENEIIEGKRIILKDDSWPFTAISIPKTIYVVDSKGKKWRIGKRKFKQFIRKIENANSETPKTVKEETIERKKQLQKELELKDSKFQVF